MPSLALTLDILAKDRASKEFRNVGDAADDAGGKTKKFGALAAAGAAAAATALVALGKSSVSAFIESEQSSLRLDEALKNFPATADRSRDSFDKLNEALAQKTKFDDDATASGQAVLAQFKLTGAQIQELTPLLQDYASKTGKTLPDAALDLGKAIQGQGRALKAVGLDLKDTGSQTGNLSQLTAGLRTQVGGFATAEGKTAAGSAAILQNRFGELQEKIGAKLIPVLKDMANRLLEVIGFVERNQAVIVPLVIGLGAFATVIGVITAAAKAYTAVQAALNIVLAANPVGLVILAVAGLAAGLVLAYKKAETFRDIVNGALAAVKTAFIALSTTALGVVSKILGGYQALAEAAGRLPGPLGAPFRAAADAIGGAKAKVDALRTGIETLKGKEVTVVVTTIERRIVESEQKRDENRGANQAGQKAVVGRRALGGPVAANRPYLVGEREPEVFVPRQSGQILNQDQLGRALGGSTTVNNFYNSTADPAQTVALLRRLEALNA